MVLGTWAGPEPLNLAETSGAGITTVGRSEIVNRVPCDPSRGGGGKNVKYPEK